MNDDLVGKPSEAKRPVRRLLLYQERNNEGLKYVWYGRKYRRHRIRLKKQQQQQLYKWLAKKEKRGMN